MYVITPATSRVGIRVHRQNCSRAGNGVALEQTTEQDLLAATLATCCKPNAGGVDAAISEVLRARRHNPDTEPEQTVFEPEPEPDPEPEQPVDEDGTTPVDIDTEGDHPELEVPESFVMLQEAKVSKHYWVAFGRGAAEAIAKAFAVEVEFNNVGQTVTFRGAYAEEAREALLALWVSGFADFKVWRRTDEKYKALPPQDTHWYTSERYKTEQAWLRGFTAARAESFGIV